MRWRRTFLGPVAVWLTVTVGTGADDAQAQYRDVARDLHSRFIGLSARSGRSGQPLGTFSTNRFRGLRTRHDRLRQLSPLLVYRGGLLGDPPATVSPVRQLLDRHNLLQSRSPLGRRLAAMVGRQDHLRDATGRWHGDVTATATEEAGQFLLPPAWDVPTRGRGPEGGEEDFSTRMGKKADAYFDLGSESFRSGDLLRARYYFEMVRDLERDRPRAFVADVFVSYAKEKYHRAVMSLLRALRKSKTLDDLKLDRFIERFYAGEDLAAKQREFGRTVESVNLFAKSQSDDQTMNLLLAYFAWLNGDLGTAIAAAELAAEAFEAAVEPLAPHVREFHKRLIAAKGAGAASAASPGA